MDSSTLVLGLRVALALACVLGLLWYAGRRMSGTAHERRSRAAALTVVSRQSLGGRSALALVEVSGRRLLLGVSEHGVNLLTEIEAEAPEAEPARVERVELDPAELEALTAVDVVADLPVVTPATTEPAAPAARPTVLAAVGATPRPKATGESGARTTKSQRSAAATTPPSTPAARMPAVPKPRHPLEGSILDATTWRQAVVAVQERTIRR